LICGNEKNVFGHVMLNSDESGTFSTGT